MGLLWVTITGGSAIERVEETIREPALHAHPVPTLMCMPPPPTTLACMFGPALSSFSCPSSLPKKSSEGLHVLPRVGSANDSKPLPGARLLIYLCRLIRCVFFFWCSSPLTPRIAFGPAPLLPFCTGATCDKSWEHLMILLLILMKDGNVMNLLQWRASGAHPAPPHYVDMMGMLQVGLRVVALALEESVQEPPPLHPNPTASGYFGPCEVPSTTGGDATRGRLVQPTPRTGIPYFPYSPEQWPVQWVLRTIAQK